LAISAIFIQKENNGYGLSSCLLSAVAAEAAAMSCRLIRIFCFDEETKRFFRTFGASDLSLELNYRWHRFSREALDKMKK